MNDEDPGAFRVEAARTDGHVELRLVGELDIGTAAQFAQVMEDSYDPSATTVVLELSELDFIDSTGLAQLVGALRRQRERGGDVVLQAPRANILRVLEIVGLTEVFTVR